MTNDLAQNSSDAVQIKYAMRWKVKELHRELKQTTGIQPCQCRYQRIQSNDSACAFLVWARLKNLAYTMKTTIYAVKNKFLDDYMRQQLCSPAVSMRRFA